MAVFYIYVPDGGEYDKADMEYSANAEVVRRQLASRVRTSRGSIALTRDMETCTPSAAYAARRDEEWPPATDRACMYVWRRRTAATVPDGPPDEVWHYSGNTDRPHIGRRRRDVSARR